MAYKIMLIQPYPDHGHDFGLGPNQASATSAQIMRLTTIVPRRTAAACAR